MIDLELGELARLLGGRLVLAGADTETTTVGGSVETDSRKVSPGSIFFAMPGEVTDGHLFAPAAVEAGAVVVIAERELDLPVSQVIVANGVARDRGARTRGRGPGARSRRLRVVAVTGSNGKTTTKNMLRAILEAEGRPSRRSDRSTTASAPPPRCSRSPTDTEYLIVEMGASAIGEIAQLISIVTPDVGIVLKVGLAHVGEFGGPDAVERAKSEMVTDLPATAIAVLNLDDPRVADMAALTQAKLSWFGLDEGAAFRATDISATATGTAFTLTVAGESRPVQLRILGEHHVMNALAAIAAAHALGVPLERSVPALETLARAARWRMEVQPRDDGVVVINDAYNASPDSMAAALKTLAQIVRPGQRSVAVLGEMAELGEYADDEHDRIGRLAVRLNIGKLIVVGHRARHIHNAAGLEGSWDGESVLVADADEAYDVLRGELREGDVVLVKSSGSAGLRFLGDRIAGVTE